MCIVGGPAHVDAEVVGGVSGDVTPQIHAGGGKRKPEFTLSHFEHFSAESPASSKLDARLKWRLVRLKMEERAARIPAQKGAETCVRRIIAVPQRYKEPPTLHPLVG